MSSKIRNRDVIGDSLKEKDSEYGLLEDVQVKLQKLLSKNPLSYELDLRNHQELVYNIKSIKRKKVQIYLFSLLISLGFRLVKEIKGKYTYRYFYSKKIAIHLDIHNTLQKSKIDIHIDIGKHDKIIRNTLTSALLSGFHKLLQYKFPKMPLYIKSGPKLDIKLLSFKILQNLEELEKGLVIQFNKVKNGVIITATRESIKKGIIVPKERLETLIYDIIKTESVLDMSNPFLINKLELLIHKSIDDLFSKVRDSYSRQIGPKPIPVKRTRIHFKRKKVKEPRVSKLIDTEKISHKAPSSSRRLIEKSKIQGGEEFVNPSKDQHHDTDYREGIQSLVNSFCYSNLEVFLSECFMTRDEAQQRLVKPFNQFLKTISPGSKPMYVDSYEIYFHQRLPSDFSQLLGRFHNLREVESKNVGFFPFWRWLKDYPLRVSALFIYVFLVSISLILMGELEGFSFYDILLFLSAYPEYIILLFLSVILSKGTIVWTVLKIRRYRKKLKSEGRFQRIHL